MSVSKELVNLIKGSDDRGTKAYDTPATVTRVEGSTVWVHIPGGVDETPVKRTINAKAGDVVQVRVSGGSAWLNGNSSAPPTDDSQAILATEYARTAGAAADSAVRSATEASEAASDAKATADSVHDIAVQAQEDAEAAQESLKSVVQGATTVEKAVSVMQTALEAVVDYDPQNDTVKEYFWHDANGAHVLGDDNGYRNDITSTGMQIMDVTNEESVAEFGASGARIGRNNEARIVLSPNYLDLISSSGVKAISVSNSGYIATQTIVIEEFQDDITSPNTSKTYLLNLDNVEEGNEFTVVVESINSLGSSGLMRLFVDEAHIDFTKGETETKTFSIKFVKTGSMFPGANRTFETLNGTISYNSSTSEVIITAPNFVLNPSSGDNNIFTFDSTTHDITVQIPTSLLSGLTYLSLDTSMASGTPDDDLYNMIDAFNWGSDVIE